ncbi:serine/arginine repetitive matrix protein 1 isoform X1 [Ceratitis capitata]|uniref:serine/arginine repetitive matrix protein 1 isoform X1 n=2 Tax=Ceratitis capitata TaxID=7213 RepID=UPI000329A07E|nr:serine/arginine repetitive matrix protein 1 isoform X1 [Ceratitis capitata]XP_012155896.1 serine/arginine repetitive matrix protein 1 isoform X1 [Ceratitis capitata]XP_012155897.1 serine/arginine repetitive matrix protein 1 isoform X1 [Ceratitis capitata]
MSTSRRRGELNPKLHMDRQPTVARITDPSLPAGKRREIDNVMKKARANTNDYWDKKLLEVEEKDPNRWRHTGYKKMYIQGDSSSGESDREGGFRYNSASGGPVGGPPPNSGRYARSRSPRSRSHSRLRKSPPLSPHMRRRSPPLDIGGGRRMSPPPMDGMRGRPRSPPPRGGIPPRSPSDMGRGRMPGGGNRPRSPPEPPMRRKSSRSPLARRRSPPNIGRRRSPPPAGPSKRGQILPRSKRPPSPPPRNSCRSRSNSSVSSCSDDSCSVCSPKHHNNRSRSQSIPRARVPGGPRSPPPKTSSRSMQYRGGQPPPNGHTSSRMHARPTTPPPPASRPVDKYRDEKARHYSHDRSIDRVPSDGRLKLVRSGRHSPNEDLRVKNRPPEPPEPAASSSAAVAVSKKKKKDREIRTRIKIEGEKRKKHSSSESDDSGGSDSDSSLPTFIASTGLTLSERFGKMAQWSIDRSNMENMRITKDSTGGALKVMIEEGLESPPRRYSYSPAPAGHFPEELATTAPSGMLSWDDVRVRYEYYKSRGYLRDLDLKDYIKWEEWWYKYQEWLKQERYYEYWERQQLARRRRKKLPITQRLN